MLSVKPNNSSMIDDDQYIETFNSESNYDDHLHAEFEFEHQIVKKRSKRFIPLLIEGISAVAKLVSAGTEIANTVHKYQHEGNNNDNTGDIAQTLQQVNQNTYMLNRNSIDINQNFDAIQRNSLDIRRNLDEIQQNRKGIAQSLEETQQNRKGIEHNLDEIKQNRKRIEHNLDEIKQNRVGIENNLDEIKQNRVGINRNYDAIQEFEHNVNANFKLSMVHFQQIENIIENVLTSIQDTKVEILDRIQIAKAEILQSIKASRTEPIVSDLSAFFDYFTRQAKAISALSLDERIARLEEADGIVHFLKNSKTPQPGTLYTLLSYIINERFAIPTDKNDKMSEVMLQLLCYGVNVYVFIMFFLAQQYELLTENCLHKKDIEKYNKLYLSSLVTFKDFSNTLIDRNGLLDKVTKVLNTVKDLHFIQKDVIDFVDKSLANFRAIRQYLDQSSKRFVLEVPRKINSNKLNFAASQNKTPLHKWKSGATVNYAIQFVGNDSQVSSLISEWSSDYPVDDLANPIVQIPIDPQGRTRVIYRKFDNYKPEMVAVIKDSTKHEFRDINRDLYNSASLPNQKVALRDISILIENGADVNALFEQNKAAIHVAAENNNWNVAYVLIQNGANIDVKDDKGHSPIYIATEAGYESFVRNLVQNGPNVNVKTNKAHLELTPLHTAAYKGHKSIVQFLLQLNQTDLNVKSSNGFTPLHFAASFDQADIVRLLVADKRTEHNVKSEQQFTPLHLASINNCDQVVQVLLGAESVDLNAQTADKTTPLHLASVYGSENVVASLLKNGADVNAKSANGSTVLHYAAVMGNPAIISSVTSESTVNAQNDFEITPLYVAYQYNNTKAASKLVDKYCANANIRLSGHKTMLHLAAINGDIKAVHNLIDQKHSVATKDAFGNDPLYYAVQNGRVEIARILLQNNADPNSKDLDNKPILHQVTELDEIDALNMVKILVQYKANINITDKFNNTLLHIAIMKGYLSILKFLLEKGADVNAKNINTPLRLTKVLQQNRSDIASFLAQKSAQDSGDKVDFLDACYRGNLILIKYLHEVHKVDIQVKDSSDFDRNGLSKAIEGKGNLEVIKYLVNIGVSIRKIDKQKYTLVNLAAIKNKFDIVKYLIEKGADFKSVNTDNSSPLHYAAENNNLEMIKYLLHLGLNSNINDKGYYGRTPLIYSLYYHSDLKLVKYLIKSGAQTNIPDNSGATAFSWKIFSNKIDIKQYLEQFSPDAKLQTQIDTNSLFFAAAQNNIKLVEQYLNKNISVNVKDEDDDQTPLYRAIYYNGQLDMIKFLVSKGADFKQFNTNTSDNLVYLSIIKHKFDVAMYLIENGANYQTAGISGNTPLHGAIEVERIDIFHYLLERDAYNNQGKSTFKTAFDLLIKARNEKLIKYLMFEYKNKQEQTMLHMAAFLGDDANVQFLLERGANINSVDKLKNTPLHLAAQNGHLETVKLLTKQICVDTFAKNGYNQAALDVAQYNRKHDVAEYLSQQMASISDSLTQFQMPTHFRDSIPLSSNAMPNKFSPCIDLNSTLFLFDILARKFTGQKYFNAQGRAVCPTEARTYSLTLVQQYEKMLNQLTNNKTVSQNAQEVVIECDFFELYRTIERYMLSGQYSRIDRLLYSHAHKALSTSNTSIDDSLLRQMIDRVLIETNKQRGTGSIVKSHSNISDIASNTTPQSKPNLIDTNTKQQFVC